MKIEEAKMRLRSYPEFAIVIEAAKEKQPFLLQLDPSKSWEQQTAQAFFRSGEIRGFESLLTYLTR